MSCYLVNFTEHEYEVLICITSLRGLSQFSMLHAEKWEGLINVVMYSNAVWDVSRTISHHKAPTRRCSHVHQNVNTQTSQLYVITFFPT